MQDCSNSIANALELLQSCTKPSMLCYILLKHGYLCACKTAVTPLLMHWSYCSLALSHQCYVISSYWNMVIYALIIMMPSWISVYLWNKRFFNLPYMVHHINPHWFKQWLFTYSVTSITWMNDELTHLPLDKMAAILLTIFSDAFLWMKSFVFWLKVCS